MHIILTRIQYGKLLIKTIFSGSLEWPLYTGLTVFGSSEMSELNN